MFTPSTDERFLHRALELARQGIGLTSPNPCVGAVIVDKEGIAVGEGFHTYAGRKHAEILAIEQAGDKARGSTLYINLEPCFHQGRTGPCADAVIAAGIQRVVASMADPNPQVSGSGFERLRTAGIHVEAGGLEADAKRLNEAFAKYIRQRIPLVTLKSAMTLDGKIAPPGGMAKNPPWITGEAARAHVQELRHQHDAILVGVGTVIADNPLLTDRSGHARRRPLLRVILDSNLRLPLDSQVVKTATNDVVVFCSSPGSARKRQMEQRGIRVEQIAANAQGFPDLAAVLHRLGEMEVTSLLMEGGSTVNGAALSTRIVDKVFFYYASTILGEGAVPLASGAHFTGLNGVQVHTLRLHRFGGDFAVEGYLRDPYGE